MDYDVEREKRKSEEIRTAFREVFPLCDENDLPWAPSHIKGFLRDRIKREVQEGVFHFQSRVCRILCEVSPPKSHIEDMCRIVTDQAKEAETLGRRLEQSRSENDVLMEAMKAFADRIGFKFQASMGCMADVFAAVMAELPEKIDPDPHISDEMPAPKEVRAKKSA